MAVLKRAPESAASEARSLEPAVIRERRGWLSYLTTFLTAVVSIPLALGRRATCPRRTHDSDAKDRKGKQLPPLKSKFPAINAVAENCAHPQEQCQVGSNGHARWVHCRLCLSRWEAVNPPSRSGKGGPAELPAARTRRASGSADPPLLSSRGLDGGGWVSAEAPHSDSESEAVDPSAWLGSGGRGPPLCAEFELSSSGLHMWIPELGWVSAAAQHGVSELKTVDPPSWLGSGGRSGPRQVDRGSGPSPPPHAGSSTDDGGLPLCECRNPSQRRVSGQKFTKGRHFFNCAAGACEFFMWDPVDRQRAIDENRKEHAKLDWEKKDKAERSGQCRNTCQQNSSKDAI